MKVARFKDGDSVLFDRMEEHDTKLLFFRGAIGLVHAKEKDLLDTIEDADSTKG